MAQKITKNVRLPKHIVPLHYRIHLVPDLDNFVFEGEEEIKIDAQKPTNKITLHSAELEILSIELVRGRKVMSGKISYSKQNETATFTFPSKVNVGLAKLKLKFAGILNDKMRGFYRSRYQHNEKEYHMGVTQFESTDARRAFPCFDEPAQKAVFEVSLRIPQDRTLISNTIETEVLEHEGGFKTVKFVPTPKMSSYLLAFIVGHFESSEARTKSGVLVRVFVTPGKKHQANFALETAVSCVEFYEKYFDIKYPLPSIDLIAIPDFAAGAMENWGAVTYRETTILVDRKHSSTQNKQWIALVIAHELAHQWFGNLVTMEWWTHRWLNEGFASFMEYKSGDTLCPAWSIWTQFVFIEQARALALDGLLNTHPIEVDVNHPAEISEIFDAVSYSKGSSVIRMLEAYLGEVDFRDGLRLYLKKHKYANATTRDLWDALSKSSKKPVSDIMQKWTREAGYPLISLTGDGKVLKIEQSRFFSSALSAEKSLGKTIWPIPVSFVGKRLKSAPFLFDKRKTKIKSISGGWIKANPGETSLVRVNYSGQLLDNLSRAISSFDKNLSEEDRFGFIRDAFALSEAGKISTGEVLKLALSYKNDGSYIVWVLLSEQFLKLRNLFFDELYFEDFKRYMSGLFSEIVERVGWEKKTGEDHARSLLRGIAIYMHGLGGDKKTIKRAQNLFGNGENTDTIDPDIRASIYSLVAENGGAREYRILHSKFMNEKFEEEKDRLMRALCQFSDKKVLTSILEFSFSKEARGQDTIKAVNFVWANPYGRDVAWSYVKFCWPRILERFGGGHLFSRFILPAANFTKGEEADDVESFFGKNKTEGIERTVAQAVEQIRSNAAWLERDSGKIKKFLQK